MRVFFFFLKDVFIVVFISVMEISCRNMTHTLLITVRHVHGGGVTAGTDLNAHDRFDIL